MSILGWCSTFVRLPPRLGDMVRPAGKGGEGEGRGGGGEGRGGGGEGRGRGEDDCIHVMKTTVGVDSRQPLCVCRNSP